MAETWMRIVVFAVDDPSDAARVDYMRKSVQDIVRRLEQAPGFQLGYWGNNAAEGRMAAVTYWSSRQTVERAVAALADLQAERARHGIRVERAHNVQLFTGTPLSSSR